MVIGLRFACCVFLAVFLLLMCEGRVIETIVNIVKDLEKQGLSPSVVAMRWLLIVSQEC